MTVPLRVSTARQAEAGVADLEDPALKERLESLKAIRDQAQADAARAAANGA